MFRAVATFVLWVSFLAADFPVEIYLIRHGQTDANLQNRLQARFPNTPLNQTGEEQAFMIGKEFASKNISKIYASDYTRAQQTAAIIAGHLEGISVQLTPALREQQMGNWIDKTPDEILQLRKQYRAICPPTREAWVSYKGDGSVESYAEMHERLKNFLQETLIPDIKAHPMQDNSPIALVSHGMFIVATLYHLLDYNHDTGLRIENCGWVKLLLNQDGTIQFVEAQKVHLIPL